MANFANSFNVGDDGLSFGESSVTGIFSDSFNPSTGSGQAGPIGSLFLYSGGTLFIKTSAADTGWTPIEATVNAGLALYYTSGNTLNVSTANDSRIVVTNSGVDLATTGISGGTYTKLTVDQYGRSVIGDYISSLDVTTALGYTPQQESANLTTLSNTDTTGIYTVTGAGTSATREIVMPVGMSIVNPDGVAGNPTISLTNNLLAAESLATLGLIAQTVYGTWVTRTLVAPSSGFSISNPDGIAGNPTFVLSTDLAAIEGLATTGLAVRTGISSWSTTEIAGTANQIVVINGDGISGDPVISLASNTIIPGSGALTIPSGATLARPNVPTAGMIRWNTQNDFYEGWDTTLSAWDNFASQNWVIANYQPINANLTALANTSGVGIYVVTGNGTSVLRSLTSSGSTLNITDANGFNSDINLDISSTYPGQSSIITVGTITTGNWQGGTIGVYYGGTGLTTMGMGNQLLGVNGADNALEYKTLTAGTAISIANTGNVITINNTGVTSLAAGTGINISGSTGPVTIANMGVLSVTSTSQSVSVVGTQNITISGPVLYAETSNSPILPSATGLNSVAIGYGAIAGADNSLALGEQALTRIHGGVVQANGRFATSGDAQTGRYVLRAYTVSSFPSEGLMDGQGGSVRLVLADNSTWTFRIMVTAQRTDAHDGRAGFQLKGVIYRVNGAATVSLQGAVTTERFASSDNWNVIASADTTNGSLKLQFTGEDNKVIRWVALVETVEVSD